MLGDKDIVATLAVKDLQVARQFYEDKLGLKPDPGKEAGVITYTSGKSKVLVYVSQFAGTNKATAATWMAGDDVKGLAGTLKAKGVRFEHYDFPGAKRDGDVHLMGEVQAAWFKDPDGNILALVNG